MTNKKEGRRSPSEQRRLEKEARKAVSDALTKDLRKDRNLRVRQTSNKDLEITIDL